MPQFCANCGTQLNERVQYCPTCGNPVPQPNVSNPVGTGTQSYYGQPVNRPVTPVRSATGYVVFGFIFALISLWYLPPVFGGLAIYFGTLVKRAGQESLGKTLTVVGIICMIVGMLVGAILGWSRA